MKKLLFIVLFIQSMIIPVVAQSKKETRITPQQKGTVKGRITDAQGNPMSNVKVVIENTLFYASYVYATTDATGNYSATVPAGSWKASARIEKSFLGKTYRFDLHPDNAQPFAGTAGAVRNFSWKISGEKPDGSGLYGSNIAVYSQPGSSFIMEEVEITLTPEGFLVDGNKGNPITKSLTGIGGGEDGIKDIPIGKYTITAKKKSGKPLQVRLRNKGSYSDSLTAVFDSGFTGLTTYQIVIQVRDKDDL